MATEEQRKFVETLLGDWAKDQDEIANAAGYPMADRETRNEIAARRAEFERLFPKDGA